MREALIFLLRALMDFYLLTFLLRLLLQWARASHYNPFAQLIYKLTSPLVIPARRVLPSIGRLDTATVVVMVLLEIVATWLLASLAGLALPIAALLIYSLLRLVQLVLLFYTFAILIYALLSWFAGRDRNPMGMLLAELVEPVLRPARRLLPPVGGIDLSPLIVLLLLQAAMIALPALPPGLR